MKIIRLACSLILLLIMTLTACGSPPLVRPEGQVAATEEATPTTEATEEAPATVAATEEATPTPAPTEEATATPAPTEETPTETPPTTGEATVEPTAETPTTEPTATTELTATATTEPAPTLTTTVTIEPTPTLTPTVVIPEGGVTVGKYTFGLPQGVPIDLEELNIVGWLPDNPDEIVDGTYQILAINIYTGQVREFSEKYERLITIPSVRLLKNDKIAFIPESGDPQKAELWINSADNKQVLAPIAVDPHVFPILLQDQESLLLYDVNTKQTNLLSKDGVILPVSSDISAALEPLTISQESGKDGNTQPQYLWTQSASSPTTRWTALYNSEHFALIDLNTGESKEIALSESNWLWVYMVYWSPDGQKLALLVTEGDFPLSYLKLFVLEIEDEKLQEIKVDTQYVTNATWAPDSENLLISAKTYTALDAEGEQYDATELFLVNIPSAKIDLIPILPKGTDIGFIRQVSWAPDGRKIALSGYIPDGNKALYRVDVTTP